jgi:DNA-binding NarL/FixJ family response regulator
MSGYTIIIVEDEFLIQADYQQAIDHAFPNATIYPLPDSRNLLDTYHRTHPDLIVTDLVMDSENEGISGITEIREIDPRIPIIVASGHAGFSSLAEAFGISLKLQKPVSGEVLVNAIKNLLVPDEAV